MSDQFKVYLPLFVNDKGVSSTTPAKIEDGQQFKEVYIGPEFFIDRSQSIDEGVKCVTIRKMEPNVIHLSDYEDRQMNQLCRLIHMNPSYCELFYCRVGKHPYVPSANGLKLWKIQRHLYRYINDVVFKVMLEEESKLDELDNIDKADKLKELKTESNNTEDNTEDSEENTTMLNEGDLNLIKFVDLIGEGSLYELSELSPGDDDELQHYMKDLNISFATLDARGRFQEIASQIRHHNISFELKLRDGNGQVFHILD